MTLASADFDETLRAHYGRLVRSLGAATGDTDAAADAVPETFIRAYAGWMFEVEQSTGRELEVKFTAAGARVDVNAELEDGRVRIRVRDRATDDDRSGPGHGGDDRDDDDD